MAINIVVKDGQSGKTIELNMEHDSTIEDLIIRAADFWNKSSGSYLLKYRSRILNSSMTISEANIRKGTPLVLILDPEGG